MNNYTRGSSPTIELDMQDSFTVWGDRWGSKQRIEQLFRERKELDYWDILKVFGLDLILIVEICEGLEKEGKIETING